MFIAGHAPEIEQCQEPEHTSPRWTELSLLQALPDKLDEVLPLERGLQMLHCHPKL